MKTMRAWALVLALVFVVAGIYAQGDTSQTSKEGTDQQQIDQTPMSMGQPMRGRAEEMRKRHQKMIDQMKMMDNVLQQKIIAMNSAMGEQKIIAITDVLNEMFKQRKTMHEQMATMHQEMCDQMENGMRGDMETTRTTQW